MTEGEVTRLLARYRGGEREALDDLMPLVYRELRRLAQSYFRGERSGHTLQATALVHEAFLRMTADAATPLQNRSHFFAVAATAMRRILIDHARRARAEKRGGPLPPLSLDGVGDTKAGSVDVLVLDILLRQLEELDPRQGRIVEMRCFAGLGVEEIAQVLGVSEATVKRDWTMAKAWLRREILRTR